MSNQDFPVMEGIVKNIVKEKQPFERLEMKKEDLLEMFKVSQLVVNHKLYYFSWFIFFVIFL